jgi:SAM-dependent methyltransferase
MDSASPENLSSYFPQPASFFVPARQDMQELLDLGAGSGADVQANFADLRRINHYLGGVRALTYHLYPRLARHRGSVKMVDIGAGSADLTVVIARWARQRQINLKLWALDLSARNLAVARCQELPEHAENLIQADALHLPFKPGCVDYFISCLFLHHLSPEEVINLLAQTFESARRGIVMSDLVRGRLPVVAFKLGQPVFARSYLTRHDGVVSIRRAYTPHELRQLAQTAGLSNARVYQHVPWRMTLVAEK